MVFKDTHINVALDKTFAAWVDGQGLRGESYNRILKRLIGYPEPTKAEIASAKLKDETDQSVQE